MFLIKLIGAIAYISLGLPDAMLGVAWPSLRQEFRVPMDYLGLLLASTFTGYLLSSSLASRLASRLGIGWLLVASSLTMTMVMLGFAWAPNFYVLIGLGLVGGLGGGAIDASLNSYIAHRFTIRMVNWLHGCWGIGAFCGPLLMTWVLIQEWSWRVGYGLLAIALGTTSLLLLFTHREWNLDNEPTEELEAAPSQFWAVIFDPQVLGQCFLYFLYTGIESTVGQLLFTYWTEGRDISKSAAGAAVTGYWVAFTLARFALGQLSFYVSGESIVKVAAAAMPVVAFLLWWRPIPNSDLILVVLFGALIAPIFPTWIGITPKTVRREFASQAIGFQVSAAAIGIVVIPGTVSFLAQRQGLQWIPASIFAITVVFSILHAWLLRSPVQPLVTKE